MKTTILQFQSLVYLTAFRKFSKAKHWEVNISHLTVLCDCSTKEAEFACSDFNATVLSSRGTSLKESLASQGLTWETTGQPLSFGIPTA